MQTFLPFEKFWDAAQALDNKRLNKQILECYQILKVLCSGNPKAAWRNHPAVLMWEGHEGRLFEYALSMVNEAKRRGIKTDKNLENLWGLYMQHAYWWSYEKPEWEVTPEYLNKIIWTHRSSLFNKDPDFYSEFFNASRNENTITCCDTCKYFWYSHEKRKAIA